MITFNPHTLIEGKVKPMPASEDIMKLFNMWMSLLEENQCKISLVDGFIAGYFLGTNSMLREKYRNRFEFENKECLK